MLPLSCPRPRCVFCVRVASFASFASFAHPTGMHSVDAMREDTTVLKKTRTSKTRMRKTRNGRERRGMDAKDANVKDANAKDAEWTRKTQLGCEFSLILKFKALATKKRTVLLTVFTHSPMHTDARRNSISGTHAELRNRIIE